MQVCVSVCVHVLALWQNNKVSVSWDFRVSGKAFLLIKWTIFTQQMFNIYLLLGAGVIKGTPTI